MALESVGLSGFRCEKKDRVERGGGGVACYVTETLEYDQVHEIEDDNTKCCGLDWSQRNYQKNTRVFL